MKGLCYLASPYSHEDKDVELRRFDEAVAAAGRLMQQGLIVFSPIVHCRPIALRDGLPHDYEYWKNWNRTLINKADLLLVLCIDGWRQSVGVTAEIALAVQLGKYIRYVRPDRNHDVCLLPPTGDPLDPFPLYDSQCPCAERGADGTTSHSIIGGSFIAGHESGPYSSWFRPCANHELNYLNAKQFVSLVLPSIAAGTGA